MSKNSPLEEGILQAAETLFLEKGFNSTSTTDIAKKAGCNQALVHYYFRTKENLFQQIFTKKFQMALVYLHTHDNANQGLLPSLQYFVESYFEMFTANRKLPFFLIKELIMNEERRKAMRLKMISDIASLNYYAEWDKKVKKEIEQGNIRPIETMDLTLNVMSLIIFTFISLPLYSDLFEQNEDDIQNYLQHRKNEIVNLIVNGLRKI
ncbi:MAG: TetR/AcrR family transcriptional regulator [Bacteroidales bacterium]|nr:TetR/AcrR family transcriptional regulator [Bacteroidales bacterium]